MMGIAQAGKLLILSVGYGQGHHSAAAALAEHYTASGWACRVEDVCELSRPVIFRLTQLFYGFCVRRAPWLWGVTYSLTDTADWAKMVERPAFISLLDCMRSLLHEWEPDLIVCTYPLFAYILDALQRRGVPVPPYAVLVTDAREISRPWMRSCAPLVLVPDEGSRRMVMERYALSPDSVIACGFPVKRAFTPSSTRQMPGERNLRILYGAYRQTQGVINDISSLLASFPQLKLTVLAGSRQRVIRRRFTAECAAGRLEVMEETKRMPELLTDCHFYIGKAGAATMFECYSSCVPPLVNFTLPGQERGNLELLLEDGAGCHVESTAHLIATLQRLLKSGAVGWLQLRQAIMESGRSGAAVQIENAIRDKFGL